MQQEGSPRARLSIGTDVETLLRSAIRRTACITAVYNQGEVLLAPHMLYLRHEQLHVACITVTRDGVPPKVEKLASYRVSGMSKVKLTNSSFKPRPDMLAERSHPADEILVSVEASGE